METSQKDWNKELAELTLRFVNGLENRMEEMKKEVDSQNWEKVAALAHRLKGAAASYGFKDLAEEVRRLEQGAKSKDGQTTPAILEGVELEIERSKTSLESEKLLKLRL